MEDAPLSWQKRLKNLYSDAARAVEKKSPFKKLAIVFFCQGACEEHAWQEGFEGLVHEPFVIKTPGETLRQLRPLIRGVNNLLWVTSTVGAFAGFPIPKELPFLGDLQQNIDCVKFLGGLYDDAPQVQDDGTISAPDRADQVEVIHNAAEGASELVAGEDIDNRSAGYETLKRVLKESHPNWKEKCGLDRRINNETGAVLWLCEKCRSGMSSDFCVEIPAH